VNNGKRPFGLQIFDFTVWDCDALDGVHNFDGGVRQYQPWSKPNQVDNESQDGADSDFDYRLSGILSNKNAVQRKKAQQQIRRNSPGVIASGSKSFFHKTIIAGVSK
jgi:hypothetical protein